MQVEELKKRVRRLSKEELAAFLTWLDETFWDEELEADVAEGRLEEFAEKARQALREGRCTDL